MGNETAIIVGLAGGLGNQMFQYSAGRALASRLGLALWLDLSWYVGRRDRHYALAPFGIEATICANKLPIPEVLKRQFDRVQRRFAATRMGMPIFRERHFHFDSRFAELSHPVFLEGYWQSSRYFAEVEADLRREFSIREALPVRCRPVAECIAATDAICLHVRRGDYVTNPATAAAHMLCSIDYYRQGLDIVTRGLSCPHAFIFSDDIQWARQNLTSDIPITMVDVNGGGDVHWDLALMARCRRFVIANSSLSWWAAWLGQAADKQVIAPAAWFRDATRKTQDLIPHGWKLL